MSRPRLLLLAVLLLVVVASATATTPVTSASSTFDSDAEGWTGDNPGEFSWMSTGGNPDGLLHFDDTAVAGGAAIAPAKFLGDWSGLDGAGCISYDHRVLNAGTHTAVGGHAIVISGPGGAATWDGPLPCPDQNCSTAWETFSAPLDEVAWTITSGSWSALLADVNSLLIQADHYTSISIPTANQEALDNIRLESDATAVPAADVTPSTLSVYPNPFSRATAVAFSLRSPGSFRLAVHDVAGRRIVTLARGDRPAGRYSVSWSGRDSSGTPVLPGVYMVRLEADGDVRTEKAVRLR